MLAHWAHGWQASVSWPRHLNITNNMTSLGKCPQRKGSAELGGKNSCIFKQKQMGAFITQV